MSAPPRLGLALLAAAGLAALALAPACSCDPCLPPEESALDYAEDDAWLCRPGAADDVCSEDLSATEVRADGSFEVVEHSPATDPAVDCFYVYPTMDWRPGAGLHTDFSKTDLEAGVVLNQAARFTEVCQVYAPLYRQVTLGTYVASEDVRGACFDLAFGDVLRAFQRYLDEDNDGRGIVLLGHSQGGQNVTRLLQELFDGGAELHQQLVAALPIGWPLAVADGERTGGDLSDIPVCSTEDEVGCVLAFRSYAADNDFPTPAEGYVAGQEVVCTNPADLASGGEALLSRVYLTPSATYVDPPEALGEIDTPFLLYRDYFSARCVEEAGDWALEVAAAPSAGDQRENPVNFDAFLISGNSGTHLMDMSFGQGPLIDRVAAKIAAYSVAAP